MIVSDLKSLILTKDFNTISAIVKFVEEEIWSDSPKKRFLQGIQPLYRPLN